tara:strand:- start:82 stop:777 length:696 start_codon:yes stop_codon:yes gene_type:complete
VGNKIPLEFTTTACNRPEIIESTYNSFTTRLKNVDFENSTLYINIDPAPNATNIIEVINIANKYFGNVIEYVPEKPNFAAAVLWCFNQVKGEMFFHLEDDWNLMRDVDIHQMIKLLGKDNTQCQLNKTPTLIPHHEKEEPAFIPNLSSKKYIDLYLPLMDDKINPEFQIKEIFRKNPKFQKNKSVNINPNYEFSRDIGRNWLFSKGLKRDYEKTKINPKDKWSPWITWKEH